MPFVGTGRGPGREPDGSGSRMPPSPPRKSLWSAGLAAQAALEGGGPQEAQGCPLPEACCGEIRVAGGPFTSGIPE